MHAFVRRLRVRWPLMLLVVGLCGSCGGGGSQSTDTGPDAPTMWLLAPAVDRVPPINSVSGSSLSETVSDSGAFPLQLAQLAVDLSHRLAVPGRPAPGPIACASTGSVQLTLQDRDGNGFASAGDAVTAEFSRCGMPVLARRITGTVRVEVLPGAQTSIEHDLRARIDLGDGSTLEPTGSDIERVPWGVVRGVLDVHWSDTETGSMLQATSAADAGLTMSAVQSTGYRVEMALRGIDVSRRVRFDDASVESAMAFVLERWADSLASGRVVVETVAPLRSTLNRYPLSGVVQVLAASGRALRVLHSASSSTASVEVIDKNGQVLDRPAWGTPAPNVLFWDGRALLPGGYSLNQTERDQIEAPRDTDQDFAFTILFPREPGPDYRPIIDPLFMHPVLSTLQAASSVSAGAVFRWQLGSALEDVQPPLFFRFFDPMEDLDPILPRRSIGATSVRRGALYLIRPDESLHHAGWYTLQVSVDGTHWSPVDPAHPVQLRKRNGGAVAAEGPLWSGVLPGTLLVSIDRDNTVVVGAEDDTRLRATITLAPGRSIAGMRWVQRSGEPLIMDTPDAAVTRVRYAAGSPRRFDNVLFTFTVTDDRGEQERADVIVRVGDTAPAGAALYTVQTLSSQPGNELRGLVVGGGNVVRDSPTAGLWAPQVLSTGAGSMAMFLGAPDGGVLVAGAYENAALAEPRPGRAVLACFIALCLDVGMGRFDVLEIGYAADGSIDRLAVDFEETAPDTIVQSMRGSYRFNSSVPVRR